MGEFDAVLFDFGGVFTASPFEILRAAADGFGVAPEVILRACFGSYDEDSDHPWHRLERGEVTAEDAMAGIAALASDSGHAFDPIAILRSGMGAENPIREDVVAVAREVRLRGLKTAVVTNNVKEFSRTWRRLLPLDELFDVVVDSCEEGIRKPDPRIFERALDRLDVTPARAVFLDDAPGNVAAARRLGLHAIHVGIDHRDAVAELRALVLG